MATELTCIICPRGCHLMVHDDLTVEGNSCPRGAAYGKQEVTDPRRTVTSTVRCDSKELAVCPVKTDGPIAKGKMFEVMEKINKAHITIPVHIGDIIIPNIDGEGANLVSTREILR